VRDAAAPEAAVPQITRDELVARLNDPTLTIVNVLPRATWQAKRIPRSLSLPLVEIPDRAAAVLPRKSDDIAVYCAADT
jgi:rhodanese-related sulfurtransferase